MPRSCLTVPVPNAASTAAARTAARSSERAHKHLTSALLTRLGVEDLDPDLLSHALTHRSYSYENGQIPHNERLEFLGDSVLGVVVTETLFRNYPEFPEGQLAKLRAAVVSAKALAKVARELDLGDHILLGRGEEASGGRNKPSILSDTLEAVIGAIFLQFGIDRAGVVVHQVFDPVIERAAHMGAGLDWKTSLQEITANNDLGVPSYTLVGTGPDHDKRFTASVVVHGITYDGGHGRSKKDAEQMVAEIAWQAISATLETDAGTS
jgi:ribonuclease III